MRAEQVEKSYLRKRASQSIKTFKPTLVVDDFAEKLKNLRINKRLTQDQLAKELGVPKEQLRAWEGGRREPNMQQLNELIRLLKVPSLYLKKAQVEDCVVSIVKKGEFKKAEGEMEMNKLAVVEVTKESVGMTLKAMRESKGVKRRELSERLDLSYNTVMNWETGVNTPPVSELLKMAKILNISACELLNVKPLEEGFSVKAKGVSIETFASRLQVARRQKGFTKQQLAEQLEVTTSAITSWENGLTTPNVEVLMKLSSTLNASLEFLLEGKTARSNRGRKSLAALSLPKREEMATMNSQFSTRLKEIRLNHALSQGRLAKAIGITPVMVYKWETGRTVPSKSSIQRLLNFFEMSLEEFLGTSKEPVVEKVEKVEEMVLETTEKEESLELKASLETVEVIEPVVKEPAEELGVETEEVRVAETPTEVAEIVKRATHHAQTMMTKAMTQLTEQILLEVTTLHQNSSNQLELSESEIELVKKIRQLDETGIAMLQSYLDYLTLKK